ncbi:MAG: CoA pyrophosphatase [Pseudomonadota bacterium]
MDMVSNESIDKMKARIKNILSKRTKRTIVENGFRPSGVLLPLFYKDDSYHILFTKRTENVEHHKGQISFPGGAYDKGDETLMDTALRESHEEIGIEKDDVEILGELDDIVTKTRFIISPFVGFIPYPYNFKVNTNETDELIEAPVQALLDEKAYREEDMIIEGNPPCQAYFYNYKEHVVWGATASILKQFLDLVF